MGLNLNIYVGQLLFQEARVVPFFFFLRSYLYTILTIFGNEI